jgi:heat shock protein HslJ
MPRSRSIALLLLAAAISSTLVACTTDREPPTPTASLVAELEPGEYRSISLTSITVDDFEDPMDALDLTITVNGNYRLTINDGCNAQSGPFHLEDGVMTVTQLSSTLSGCVPPRGDAGVFLSEFLSEPVTVTRSSEDMVWTSPLGEIVFKTA